MLYQNGIVVEVRGTKARVEFLRSGMCGGCVGVRGCGLGPILAMFGRSQAHSTEIDLRAGSTKIKAGDIVRIAVAGEQLLKMISLAYLLPLIGMFMGALVATRVFPGAGDGIAVIGALTGVLCVSRLLAKSTAGQSERYLLSARLESAESRLS